MLGTGLGQQHSRVLSSPAAHAEGQSSALRARCRPAGHSPGLGCIQVSTPGWPHLSLNPLPGILTANTSISLFFPSCGGCVVNVFFPSLGVLQVYFVNAGLLPFGFFSGGWFKKYPIHPGPFPSLPRARSWDRPCLDWALPK